MLSKSYPVHCLSKTYAKDIAMSSSKTKGMIVASHARRRPSQGLYLSQYAGYVRTSFNLKIHAKSRTASH